MEAVVGAKRQPPIADRQLVIFVGLPGSGKSTYYFAHFAGTHIHVSKDLMKTARSRDANQTLLVEQALSAGQSVVVDNTNPSRAIRAPLIAIGKRHGARIIAAYFQCSVRVALMRNRQREGKGRVPDVAVFVTQKKLAPPALDEGFDEVRVIACE
jgi:predicted kinase